MVYMLKEGVHNTPNMETYRTHLIWCPRHTLFLNSVGTSCNNCTGVLPPHTQRWCPECYYLCFSLVINASYSANCSKLSPQSLILTLLFILSPFPLTHLRAQLRVLVSDALFDNWIFELALQNHSLVITTGVQRGERERERWRWGEGVCAMAY